MDEITWEDNSSLLTKIKCEQHEIIEIHNSFVKVVVPKMGFWKKANRSIYASGEGTYNFDIMSLHKVCTMQMGMHVINLIDINSSSNVSLFSSVEKSPWEKLNYLTEIGKAKICERKLDYEGAITAYEKAGNSEEAKRIRQKIIDDRKVDQTVVQGDQITKTEIKDSVLNRSNIGSSGDDKFARLEKLTEMKKEGLIDDDEFKQMKKEILKK